VTVRAPCGRRWKRAHWHPLLADVLHLDAGNGATGFRSTPQSTLSHSHRSTATDGHVGRFIVAPALVTTALEQPWVGR
jgi:hypothetical protein